jgi:uncharacterized protein (DUF305 family)
MRVSSGNDARHAQRIRRHAAGASASAAGQFNVPEAASRLPRVVSITAATATITAEKMRRLERADGAGGQRLFLQGMIRHHQGAVALAETEIAEGKHPASI